MLELKGKELENLKYMSKLSRKLLTKNSSHATSPRMDI